MELADGGGRAVTLRGPAVDWTGWREISLPLPAVAERPYTVTRLSAAAGPRPARLLLDTLTARTPPTGYVRRAGAPDPIVATEAQVRAKPWRFTVQPTEAATPGADFALTGAARPAFVHPALWWCSR